jgi:hypothetical protein
MTSKWTDWPLDRFERNSNVVNMTRSNRERQEVLQTRFLCINNCFTLETSLNSWALQVKFWEKQTFECFS